MAKLGVYMCMGRLTPPPCTVSVAELHHTQRSVIKKSEKSVKVKWFSVGLWYISRLFKYRHNVILWNQRTKARALGAASELFTHQAPLFYVPRLLCIAGVHACYFFSIRILIMELSLSFFLF